MADAVTLHDYSDEDLLNANIGLLHDVGEQLHDLLNLHPELFKGQERALRDAILPLLGVISAVESELKEAA